MLNIYSSYIKKYFPSSFKTGAKYAACFYLVLGLPILMFHPLAWVLIGAIFISACGVTAGIVTSSFHCIKDYINGKRTPLQEGEKEEQKSLKHKKIVEIQAGPKTPDRDSAIVMHEEKDENYFIDKTNNQNYEFWLSDTQIRSIARSIYGWVAHRNKKGLKDTSKGVYFACTSFLETELQKYKSKVAQGDKSLIFTAILHLNNNHWVTLVCNPNKKPIVRSNSLNFLDLESNDRSKKSERRPSLGNEDNNQFKAYYCDSFGNPIPREISDALQKALKIDDSCIRSSKTRQQQDTHNCAIFALKNAHKTTQMLGEGKSFDDIDAELSQYKPTEQQLNEERKKFAKALEIDKQSWARNSAESVSRSSSRASSDSGASSISSPVDAARYDTNHGSQNLINQTQAGNYNYFLQQIDIGRLANIVHDLDPKVHEIIGSNDQLKKQLQQFKNKVENSNETQKLIFIISLQNGHWVTLCVNHCNKQFNAYYYDSLNGKESRSIFTTILKEELNMNEDNIKFFNEKTQSDGSNCGIFALEAASRINQVLDKSALLDDIDKALSEFKPTASELKTLREQFAKILGSDEEHARFVVTDSTPINNSNYCSIS